MAVTHTARVVSSRFVSKGILLIKFQLVAPAVVDFKAGQYLAVLLPNTDKESYYSIASSPNTRDSIELLVKEDVLGDGAIYLFSLKEGDSVEVRMPMGDAFLREPSTNHLVFVAGASGASYIRSMIHFLSESNLLEGRDVHYFLGCREEDELLESGYMHALAEQYSGFHYYPALSHQGDWDGHTGLITEVVGKMLPNNLSGWEAYSAGSPAMVEAVAKTLIETKGLKPQRFFSDFYNPSDG